MYSISLHESLRFIYYNNIVMSMIKQKSLASDYFLSIIPRRRVFWELWIFSRHAIFILKGQGSSLCCIKDWFSQNHSLGEWGWGVRDTLMRRKKRGKNWKMGKSFWLRNELSQGWAVLLRRCQIVTACFSFSFFSRSSSLPLHNSPPSSG